jgi:phosphoglycolate phosphatase-like HAD superfamily hydrolase
VTWRAREFRAIFFDLDGTLVDIHGPLYNAAKGAIDALGVAPPLTRERYHESLARDELWLGVPEHLRRDYMQLALAYFLAEIDRTERLEVLPHVGETLAELKRRDYATGVITSRPGDPQTLVKKLAMVGLASHLDFVITQTSLSLDALDKTASLREAAVRAGVLPTACMYVGDEPRDTMAALQAGYGGAISVATGPVSYRRLSDHQHFRPDFVMRSMGELVTLLERLPETEET